MKKPLPLVLAIAGCLGLSAASDAFGHHQPGHAGGPPGHARPGGPPGPGPGGPGGPGLQGLVPSPAPTPAAELVTTGLTRAVLHELLGPYRSLLYVDARPLPPGIAMNLARGRPLPPGIARRTVPAGMVPYLPHHEGYGWVRAGTDLVLLQLATGIVAEIVRGAFD